MAQADTHTMQSIMIVHHQCNQSLRLYAFCIPSACWGMSHCVIAAVLVTVQGLLCHKALHGATVCCGSTAPLFKVAAAALVTVHGFIVYKALASRIVC
jgi:hypothetical protein